MMEKRGPGRPRLETTMNPEWYNIIIEAGKNGYHITRFLKELGISWEGHYRLLKSNTKYSEAFHEYQKLCEEWWFNKAHDSMMTDNGAGFNTRLWQVIMNNKFKDNWKSERQIDITTNGEKIQSNPSAVQIEIIRKDDNLEQEV